MTLVGAIGGALKQDPMLALSDFQVGLAASAYLGGAVMGALLFGWLTDCSGARNCFSSLSGSIWWARRLRRCRGISSVSLFFRLLVGAGNRRRICGGQLGDPGADSRPRARPYRSRHQWVILDRRGLSPWERWFCSIPAFIAPAYGWRAAFLIGAVLGLPIFFLRFFIPESPRWLAMHGREDEAEAVME